MGKQFSDVNCHYGAPMGRGEYGQMPEEKRSVRVFKVRLDRGGYDDGGAYWGHSSGEFLYCAQGVSSEYRQFMRAGTRLEAIAKLEIPCETLAFPPKAKFVRLLELESKGVLSARGVLLRQQLQELGF